MILLPWLHNLENSCFGLCCHWGHLCFIKFVIYICLIWNFLFNPALCMAVCSLTMILMLVCYCSSGGGGDIRKCSCGYGLTHHHMAQGSLVCGDSWKSDTHTREIRTNAYGDLEFIGYGENERKVCHVFLCRLRSIATHRDHFVHRLSVCRSVCHTPIAMFRRRHMHSSECCRYFYTPVFRRDVLWYGDVRPGLHPGLHPSFRQSDSPSVRSPSAHFPLFSPTCFDLLSWNFAHDFVRMNYRSSSTFVTLR